MSLSELISKKEAIIQQYGPWIAYDIKLAESVHTSGMRGISEQMRRNFQVIQDLAGGSIKGRRVLDLACLEGQYAIEFALQGASESVGIEYRKANVEKSKFAAEALGLKNIKFLQDDVRNLSLQKHGEFDIVFCSGIFYHLDWRDLMPFLKNMNSVCKDFMILDTHISIHPREERELDGKKYYGVLFPENPTGATEDEDGRTRLSSVGNAWSFWPTRSSLYNMLMDAGFTSAFECVMPGMLDMGDRVSLVAFKGKPFQVKSTDQAPSQVRRWPENARLSLNSVQLLPHQKIISSAKHMAKKILGKR